MLRAAGFVDILVEPRSDCFTTLAQLMRNVATAMGRAPDDRDREREAAAQLLGELADHVAALAPLDVDWIFPLGWNVTARRG